MSLTYDNGKFFAMYCVYFIIRICLYRNSKWYGSLYNLEMKIEIKIVVIKCKLC